MNLDIPDYEIDSELGTGGMASVYRARHKRLHRQVALKVMHPELTLRDTDFSERFLREARIAADLSHPNIVQVYDVNLHGKNHFIAMEFVSGGDLKDRLKSPVDRDELVYIIDQITRGLDYAHSRGYIHRDIKPANILFRDSGEALVSDFGIARAMDSNTHLTKTGSVIGTPTYMSPEQASGAAVDGRSDLYSVAVIVYEILIGTVPYVGETSLSIAIKHINDPIPTLPKPLQAIQPFIDRGLAKDPNDRFSSGSELLETLQDGLDQLTADDINQTTTLLIMRPGEKSKRAAQITAVRNSNKADSNTVSGTTLMRKVETIKPHLTKIAAALILISLLIAGALSWINSQELNKAQQLQIDQLLAAAQLDVDAGRLTQPAENNAIEKYQTAKAISPSYSPTIEAVESLNTLLLQKSELALLGNEWADAETYARQILSLSPDDNDALEQLDAIEDFRQQQQKNIQSQLSAAKEAVNLAQWQQSIDLYTNLQKNTNGDFPQGNEIETLVTRLIDSSKKETTSKQFEQANTLLSYARAAANLTNNSALFTQINSAQANNKRLQDSQNRQKKIQTLLQQARASKSADQTAKLYQQVLLLDRNNATAKSGLKKSIDFLLRDAENALNARQLSTTNRILGRISSSPITLSSSQREKYDELKTLYVATNAQAADLDKLFDRFERYMQAPKVTSAEKIFRRIEFMDYAHPRLNGLRKELADGFYAVAKKEADAEDWSDAVKWSQRGLVHIPNHPQLKKLLNEALEKEKTSDKKILDFFR